MLFICQFNIYLTGVGVKHEVIYDVLLFIIWQDNGETTLVCVYLEWIAFTVLPSLDIVDLEHLL